jgi:hypothetical protein
MIDGFVIGAKIRFQIHNPPTFCASCSTLIRSSGANLKLKDHTSHSFYLCLSQENQPCTSYNVQFNVSPKLAKLNQRKKNSFEKELD